MWFVTLCATFLPAGAAAGADLGTVREAPVLRDVRLENGAAMPEVRIASETCGTLAPGGRNEHATWSPALRASPAPLVAGL